MFENLIENLLLATDTVEFKKSLIIVLSGLVFYLLFVRSVKHWLGDLLRRAVAKSTTSDRREKQIGVWILFFERTGGFVVLAIVAVSLIAEWGFNITPILTGAGIVGLALGLGSQNVMKDLIGGIFIFLEGAYSEGDMVKLAGVSGKVRKMTLRKTILFSKKDNSVHIIPNSEIKTISLIKKKSVLKD